MPDENKDVNNDQLVTDATDANNDQVVTGQGEVAESTNQQDEEDVQDQDKTVPYGRFKEVNDAKKAAEENAAHAQRQLELMQMKEVVQAQNTQNTAPQSSMEQALIDCNLTADDLYDGNNLIRVQARKDQIDAALRQQNQATIDSNQFMSSHPDSAQVIGSVNPVTQKFEASAELNQILAAQPHLSGACNTLEGTYKVVIDARKLAAFEKKAAINTEHQNRANTDIATKPIGASAAGGSGGVGSQSGQTLLTREQVAEIDADIAAGKYD